MLKLSDPAPRMPAGSGVSAEARSGPAELVATFLGMLRRRLWVMLVVALPIAVLGIAAVMLMKPKYDATTRIQIDPSRNPMVQDGPAAGLNSEAIQTEVGLMTSRELARAVVERLKLQNDPEFAPPANVPGLSADERLARTVTRVMRGVNVGRDQLSYIIALGFRSRDPQKAALIANTFARTYMDLRVQSQVGTSSRQAAFFKTRLDALAKDLNATDAALAAYKAQAGLSSDGAGGTITDQQITPLSTQLATAEADAASARSAAQTAQAQVARGGLDAVAAVRSSSVIGDLRRQRAEIVRSMGEVTARYGPKHPESIRVHDQLDAIDQQIRDEANRVVSSLQAQATAADAQVASLRSTMRQLEAQRASNTRASAQAERLEREAASKRATFDKMSQLSLESTQTARSGIAQAEIVDVAQPASAPSSPNRPVLLALVLIVAGSVGLAVGLALEMLQGGIRTVADAERRFQLPVLASIPLAGAKRGLFRRRGGGSPADAISSRSATLYSEAIRNLRLAFTGRGDEGAAQVIAFTSAVPDEGKTTTSLSLARMMAVNGTRVLLIDCDLRNIGLAKTLDLPAGPGLIEALRGELTLDAAVRGDVVAGLDLLTVATPLFTSEDMFGGVEMARLIEMARSRYQAVILDLPPVLGVADARTLAVQADVSALVVRWGRTAPRAVSLALTALQGDGVNLAGLVLAMVDPSSEAAGGTYYSRGYHKYYQTA